MYTYKLATELADRAHELITTTATSLDLDSQQAYEWMEDVGYLRALITVACGHLNPHFLRVTASLEDFLREYDPDEQTHTYTIHLGMAARSDEHAREVGRLVKGLIEENSHLFMESKAGYVVDSVHVTDSDDWAEHVGVEDICDQCGETGGTNRQRSGTGSRVHAMCGGDYAIVDVEI